MATFTGTVGNDTITPGLVTAGVVVVPAGARPGNDADIINAGAGADIIDAGGGNDTVAGQQGDDSARLGDGNDTFLWNPGDGNDTVDGGAGFDTLDFFAGNVSEIVDLASNGGHLRLTRNIANIVMDVDAVEKVIFHALGGADSITVGDLSGADVTQVVVNLEGMLGSGTGDAAADNVVFNGTDANNAITISGVGGNVVIAGLPWAATVSAVDALDRVVVNGGGGNDTILAAELGTLLGLTIDAGLGNDTVVGSVAADILIGGAGNDLVTAGRGDDVMFLGMGSDRVIWNFGDGSDTIEGQGQTDTLEFNGSAGSENFVLSANGGRTRLARDVGSVVMDMDDIEMLVIRGDAGANRLVVGNMMGTDLVGPISFVGGSGVDTVDASAAFNDMVVTGGGGADSLLGGSGDDIFRYLAGAEAVAGEAAQAGNGVNDTLQLINTGAIGFASVLLSGLERLHFASGNSSATFAGNQIGGSGIERILGGAGNDAVIARGDAIDLSTVLFSTWTDATDRITLVGSAAVSQLTGSARNDVINGGGGADMMAGGVGNDIYYVDNAGDRVFEAAGQGTDIVYSAVSYTLSPGQHVETLATTTLTGTTAVNLTGNELVQLINGNNGANIINGGGGNDTLHGYAGNDGLNGGIGDDQMYGGLGDDVFYVDIATDKVFETANQGADTVLAASSYALAAGQHIEKLATTLVTGTAAIRLTGNEFTQTLFGNEGANVIGGGGGNDLIAGYGGNDTLDGGIGNDVIYGGAGNDMLAGGAGIDYFAFNAALNPTTNVDRIVDFNVPQDTIRLDNAVMAGLGTTLGTLSAAKFWQSTTGAAHDADDRMIYETDTGKLFYDANGIAGGGAVHFATLAPNLALTSADFQVI